MKKVNDKFYTEQVEHQFEFEVSNRKCDISTVAGSLNNMIDGVVLKNAEWEEQGIDSIFATLTTTKEGNIVCYMSGTKAWTQEQVKEYEEAVNNEKEEMKVLQKLIDKHPNKALQLFSKMLDEKLSK